MLSRRGMEVERVSQGSYISNIRWLSSCSHILTSTTFPHSLQTLSLLSPFTPLSTFPFPSPITDLSLSSSLIAASSSTSSLFFISVDPITASFGPHTTLDNIGPVNALDLTENGDCVCVGEDGRVNVVRVRDGGDLSCRNVSDSDGLVAYETVKWASPTEFVTGGLGFGLHWWDLRKPGGPSAHFKPRAIWPHRATSGIVHSIDIHTSRKHTCIAGGSAGTVFAWDLRWQHQPIVLSGIGLDEKLTQSPSESDVWKVQYDNYTSSLNMGNFSSSRILPAVICSEDGILAVVEEGEKPCELLAEPCAINNFDINQENPSDIICSLEWESIAVVTRQ